MSTHPGWKRATQVKLIAELHGFWAERPVGHASQSRWNALPECKSAPAEVRLQIGGNQW